ncbi:DNA starvation/stationary phase protection protein [Acholeplasma vituli]|uniref:DNA starvation/stationary phase protection protein n=1 Tax=Paracholeplasma vituli TaxID=69473 RepID=A0ABT2PTR0_9MOLU|nr:DNA starvation/stationary phase protection protein [Paracholeplasma vituli]MCU0104339.1 DNA starvation/stationary phase protection protein [Paracholeplasma vituli]
MNKLEQFLNKEVANFAVLYTKLHNFHWYVKGPLFFQLHAKFEELYDEVTEVYDAFAERILMIGGKSVATLKGNLELASIAEATGLETKEDMIKSVIHDFKHIDLELKEGIKLAEDLEDDVTVDLMTTTRASLQKHIWMLSELLK